MKEITVAFDTSNYTTSCAAFDGTAGENRSRLLGVPGGALGLRQSDALFSHVKHMHEVFRELTKEGRIIAVGASTKPRNLPDSYMPCFLAGASHGAVLAEGLGVPFYEFSHQEGHIAAAAWSAGRSELLDAPMLCWHLSGGTTEFLYVTPSGESVDCKIIGGTRDISAGQLYDRAGNLLKFSFPSGAALDKLAVGAAVGEKYTPKTDGFYFSLSGAEHKMKAMSESGKTPEEIAWFVSWSVSSVVKLVTERAIREYGDLPVLFSGGVASSAFLRREIPDGIYCEPGYSSDNAMGIAILTYRAAKRAELRDEEADYG